MIGLKFLCFTLAFTLLTACSGLEYLGAATKSVLTHDKRSFEQQMQDKKLEIELNTLIHRAHELRRHINVNVHIINHHVFLTGQTPSTVLKNQVVDLISHHKQAKKLKIRDFIRIKPYTSLAQRTHDNYITGRVIQNNSFSNENYHIHVITEDSEVFLFGLVTQEVAKQAVEVTRKTPGVKKVVHAFELLDL